MFSWKKKATNAIYLKEDNGGKGRPFESRFLEAGLVKYSFGVCLLTKEVIDKFIDGFVGCPVIIDHQDITDENVKEKSVGVISDVWYNEKDGWFWCKGIITDKEAIDLINKGYTVSCQYEITEYQENTENKLHNGNEFDKYILNGKPEHLAIVENPRYENAYIAVNAIEVNAQNNIKEQEMFNLGKNKEANVEEIKTMLEALTADVAALKARNEAEDEEKAKKADNEDDKEDDKKATNEDVDKRKLIDEIGGILKGKVDDELWRTIIGKAEKIAYDKSEAGTADNKCKNKCKNEDDEAEYDDLKKDVEEEAENKKAKNSIEELFYTGNYKKEPLYTSQKQAIELGKEIF